MFQRIWENVTPHMPLAGFVSETLLRLILAAVLGGAIGIERELKHKPAGLRTNMFICFGAAMFTILSFRFSGATPDRIAANIIPGIGFIGAGSILHSRGSVSGLTTAATIFVVASIGMAAGGGEYLPAIFATVVILVALNFLGWFERRFNLKSTLMGYAVVARAVEPALADINRILDGRKLLMKTVQVGGTDGNHRIHFTVEAKHRDHIHLAEDFRKCIALERVEVLHESDLD
jgi:putative Mg2+ transporter-C (MgtC) family protein